MVTLNDIDADDQESKATVVIALMQKDSRLKRMKTKTDSEEFIQFKLYKVANLKKKHYFIFKRGHFIKIMID